MGPQNPYLIGGVGEATETAEMTEYLVQKQISRRHNCLATVFSVAYYYIMLIPYIPATFKAPRLAAI